MSARAATIWTFIVTSVAVFMVSLDNLVVTTALPVIKADLGASLSGLEWTVNAYTLTFAVLLLTGAALGDRFGRKRMFVVGLALFTVSSALAALAPSIEALIAARALQGVGGAIVMPLTLTILSGAVSPARRGIALGIWGGIAGLAVALGPVVGGAVVEGLSWQWIFWLNVPIGLVLLPIAVMRLTESKGPNRSLDLPGLGLASAGLLGIVWGLIRGNEHGWTSLGVAGPIIAGLVLLGAFVLWERRTPEPMVPLRFFRNRAFSAANVTSLLMSFGMFGSIFLLAQFFQIVQGYSPLEAGLRTLPWTAMPILVAPIAGMLSDRIGARPLLVAGMALMAVGLAWIAFVTSPTVRLRPAGPRLRAGRRRHEPLLRPGRQPGAEHRGAQGRGQGERRQQHDPRGRRRVRRRGAGERVQRRGQLRQPAGVRRRHGPGDLGRGSRSRPGRSRRGADPAARGRRAGLGLAARAPRAGRRRGRRRARLRAGRGGLTGASSSPRGPGREAEGPPAPAVCLAPPLWGIR